MLPQDTHGELRRHDELVALEQAGGDVPEDRGGDALGERGDALLDGEHFVDLLVLGDEFLFIGTAGADVHTLLEDVDVVRHRVLVHPVEDVEDIDEEVEQGAARGDGAVHLASGVDADLRLGRDDDFFRNFRRGPLRLLEVLDERDVLQDVALGVRQPGQ